MFSSKSVNIKSGDIIKEGWLSKESRYMKKWRKRWVVLTSQNLYTFESEKLYINPTETLDITKIKTVKTDETKQGNFFVK
jgi:hypothetical protein